MKLICFDMDDTLVRSEKVHVEGFNRAFVINGLKEARPQKIIRLFGLEGKEIIKRLFPRISKKKLYKVIEDHNNIVTHDTAKYATAIRGADGVLKKLKKNFKLALVSNCSEKEIFATMKAAKISVKLFDAVIGNDDVKHGKPSADELLLAKKLTRCDDGFMVGDTPYDIMAANAAGLKPISVTTGNYSYKRLSKKNPAAILKSITKLPKVIKGLGA